MIELLTQLLRSSGHDITEQTASTSSDPSTPSRDGDCRRLHGRPGVGPGRGRARSRPHLTIPVAGSVSTAPAEGPPASHATGARMGGRFRAPTPQSSNDWPTPRATLASPDCTVDFDDDDAVELLGGAKDTLGLPAVVEPAVRRLVGPGLPDEHRPLPPDLRRCRHHQLPQPGQRAYGTLLGEIARGADECEPSTL